MTEPNQPNEKSRGLTATNLAYGMLAGIGVGIALGVSMDSIPLGISFGIAIGVGFTLAFSESSKSRSARSEVDRSQESAEGSDTTAPDSPRTQPDHHTNDTPRPE